MKVRWEPGSDTYSFQDTLYRSESYRRIRMTALCGPPGMATQVRLAYRQRYLCFSIACRSTWQFFSAPSPPVQSEFHEELHAKDEPTNTHCAFHMIILYGTNFVCLGANAKFCRRKPIVLLSLHEILEIC